MSSRSYSQQGNRGGGRGGNRGGGQRGGGHRGGSRDVGHRGGRGHTSHGASRRPPPGPRFTGEIQPIEELTAPKEIVPPQEIAPLPEPARTKVALYNERVVSNFLEIQLPLQAHFHQFDVTFVPEVAVKRDRYRLFENVPELKGVFAFDGEKQAYSPASSSNFQGKEFSVQHNGKKVLLVLLRTAQLNAHEQVNPNFLQMMNIVLRHNLRKLGLQRIGRNLFDMESAKEFQQWAVKVLPGLVTTIKMSERGFILQVDTAYRVLRTTSFLDEIVKLKHNKKAVAHAVEANPTFYCEYNQRTIRVDGVAWNKTPDSKFTNRQGRTMTFVQYYHESHNRNIKDRKQPLLYSEARDGTTLYYVPELIFQTGLNDDMRRSLKSELIKPPSERLADSATMALKYENSEAFQNALKPWQITIGTKLLEVPARKLTAPKLIMGDGETVQPSTANDFTWNFELPNYRDCKPLEKWFILATDESYAREMESCVKKHVQFTSGAKIHTCKLHSAKEFADSIENYVSDGFEFGVVVLPGGRLEEATYQACKTVATTKCGIPIQCVKEKTIQNRKFNQIQNAIGAQITAKLQGAPWKVDAKYGESIIIGFDVFHSGVGSNKASVAAVVGSYDKDVTFYFSRVKRLNKGQEVHESEFFYDFVQDLVRKYKKHNKKWPKYCFMYRDGVGEGQIAEVKTKEMQRIKLGLRDLETKEFIDVPIKFTACVILKRINDRFFNIDKHGVVTNPEVGTLVDKQVTRESCFEFFLNAAPVAQGTATPIHVIVIENDSPDLPANVFQKMTFGLCHGYWNFARSIKVPTHCHYAHRLAQLIGEHCGGEMPVAQLEDRLFYL